MVVMMHVKTVLRSLFQASQPGSPAGTWEWSWAVHGASVRFCALLLPRCPHGCLTLLWQAMAATRAQEVTQNVYRPCGRLPFGALVTLTEPTPCAVGVRGRLHLPSPVGRFRRAGPVSRCVFLAAHSAHAITLIPGPLFCATNATSTVAGRNCPRYMVRYRPIGPLPPYGRRSSTASPTSRTGASSARCAPTRSGRPPWWEPCRY